MSNENSTVNSPLRRIRCNSSARYRKFSCITYLYKEQLDVCLFVHINQIRAYAYAYHDKDMNDDGTLKEPHFHLIIVTHNACSLSAIRRWFSGYVQNGKDVTTTAQNCTDVYQMYDYLTHNTVEAKAAGKYQYDKSIIVTNNEGYFKADEESSYDNITLACEMLINGAKTRDLGKKFGRDFILHYGQIRQYLNDIYQWEMHPEYKDVGDILEKEWNEE